jgi:hypothetical protein
MLSNYIGSAPGSGGRVTRSRSCEPHWPATADDVREAIAEMEELHDAAGLLRSVPDAVAPDEVAVRIRSLLDSGRYRLIGPSP